MEGLADRGTGSVTEVQQRDRGRKDPGRGVRARGSVAGLVWRRQSGGRASEGSSEEQRHVCDLPRRWGRWDYYSAQRR